MKQKTKKQQKNYKGRLIAGFTLIELLVVIAIIAVLAVVIVLTLNPAELLRQSRDSNRVAALNSLNESIALLQTNGLSLGSSSVVYISIPDSSPTCSDLGLPILPSGLTYGCAPPSTYTAVNGTGWVPVNFAGQSIGSTLSTLPIDPINSTSSGLYYEYATNGTQWEMWAIPESSKYAQSAQANSIPGYFTQGSNISLAVPSYNTGLVGWYKLNEGSGSSAIDLSVNNATGTWAGSQVGTSGYYSAGHDQTWAGTFDGASTYVYISSSSFTNGFSAITVSCWFNSSSATQSGPLVIKGKDTGSSSAGGWQLDIGGDTNAVGIVSFRAKNASGWTQAVTSGTYNNGIWHQAVGVWDGSNLYIYIDGSLINSVAFSGSITTNADNVQLGRSTTISFPSSDQFLGLIDDVRIYNSALSATEIQALYNSGQ
jgi:prepilin-type N-terminal cleavage/methylation domain-containing protein